ncbi:hypothetical protein IWW57_003467 [Coemansia sp. S610]|nr:hypothetical protein IWW57_003467 [Coemansia sp. S610]KAJ2415162.1 hypothetical protein GGI10_001884 [Coemansia sp. RSA 2530]
MDPSNDFRYSVHETPPTRPPSTGFLATLKRLLCFGSHTQTPPLRLASSASRMKLALALAEQYVLVSQDQTAESTPQSSPMSGVSDATLQGSPFNDRERGRRTMNSLLPKSLRSAGSPSHRSSTICVHQSDSQLSGTISPAMVAARENPLFC